ncbi:MAG: insulinase family protein, partial [Chitinophagaceae bacterium]|nr:insulinase family protein [Chitinophagaceae bacterium]
GAFMIPNEDPGVAFMYGITNAGVEPSDLEASMLAEIEKVKTANISDDEYQKLMNQAENDFVSQNQRVVGIVENLATYHTYFGDANLINTELENYTSITKEDLKRVANKYLTKNNRLVVYYLPKSEQKKG